MGGGGLGRITSESEIFLSFFSRTFFSPALWARIFFFKLSELIFIKWLGMAVAHPGFQKRGPSIFLFVRSFVLLCFSFFNEEGEGGNKTLLGLILTF